MKTYQKHLHNPERRATIPNLATKCDRDVPPSEITTVASLVTCNDCKAFL